jgi:hypothetical protein
MNLVLRRATEPRALFVSPLFFKARAAASKPLTPAGVNFLRVFRRFLAQSPENHDFYPSTPLHGGFVAM